MRRFVRDLLVVVVCSACAHAPPDSTPTTNGQIITEREIAESRAPNAYDVILQLRGNFFSNRGAVTLKQSNSPLPVVYLDGVEYGPMASLRNIPAEHIAMIRLYRAWEAGMKFGANKTGGVIEVLTRSQ